MSRSRKPNREKLGPPWSSVKEALSQERLEKKPFILPVGEAGESGQTPWRRGDLSLESQDISRQRLGNLGCKANGEETMS